MRRLVLLVVVTVLALGSMGGPAFAFHCYVEDKPNGAGAVTEEDLKLAGASGRLVAPGAFLSTEATGAEHDVFVRGRPVGEEEIVGIGTLPPQPHTRGSTEHGVQELEFEGPED